MLLHDGDGRGRFEGLGDGVEEVPFVPGVKLLVPGPEPFLPDDRKLPRAHDIVTVEESHELEGVVVVDRDSLEAQGVGDDLFEVVLGLVEGRDGQVLKGVPDAFRCAFSSPRSRREGRGCRR